MKLKVEGHVSRPARVRGEALELLYKSFFMIVHKQLVG